MGLNHSTCAFSPPFKGVSVLADKNMGTQSFPLLDLPGGKTTVT